MMMWRPHLSFLGYCSLFVLLTDRKTFQVDAIKCFVCDNFSGHSEDPLYYKYPNFMANPKCNQFTDTQELMQFSVECPAGYTACQGTVGHLDNPVSGHAFRSCYKLALGEDTSPQCRNHGYVPNIYSCPCFFDHCNFFNEVKRDKSGNPVGQLNTAVAVDSANLAVNNPNIIDKASTIVPPAGGGAVNTTLTDLMIAEEKFVDDPANANAQDMQAKAGNVDANGNSANGGNVNAACSHRDSVLRFLPLVLSAAVIPVVLV